MKFLLNIAIAVIFACSLGYAFPISRSLIVSQYEPAHYQDQSLGYNINLKSSFNFSAGIYCNGTLLQKCENVRDCSLLKKAGFTAKPETYQIRIVTTQSCPIAVDVNWDDGSDTKEIVQLTIVGVFMILLVIGFAKMNN